MEFIDLLKNIEHSHIRYLVVGGIAVNLHGIERATKDLDLVVYLERKNLIRFLDLMTHLGFRPKVPVKAVEFADPKKRNEWIKNKNMIVFSFYHERDLMKVIDVFVYHPLPFGPMYKKRELIPLGDCKIPVISIPDLIKLKNKAGRLQDRSDIRALKEVLRLRKEMQSAKKKTKKRI